MGDEAKPKTPLDDKTVPGAPEGSQAQKLKPQDAQAHGPRQVAGVQRPAREEDPIVARVREEGLFGHSLPDVSAEGPILDTKKTTQKTEGTATTANAIIADGALSTLFGLGSGTPLNNIHAVQANVSDAAISIRILKKNCTAQQIVHLLGAFESVHVLNKTGIDNAYNSYSSWGVLKKAQATLINDAIEAVSLTIKRDQNGSLSELSRSTATPMKCYYLSLALLIDDTAKSLDKSGESYEPFVRHFASIGSTDNVKDHEVRAVYLQALEKLMGD